MEQLFCGDCGYVFANANEADSIRKMTEIQERYESCPNCSSGPLKVAVADEKTAAEFRQALSRGPVPRITLKPGEDAAEAIRRSVVKEFGGQKKRWRQFWR